MATTRYTLVTSLLTLASVSVVLGFVNVPVQAQAQAETKTETGKGTETETGTGPLSLTDNLLRLRDFLRAVNQTVQDFVSCKPNQVEQLLCMHLAEVELELELELELEPDARQLQHVSDNADTVTVKLPELRELHLLQDKYKYKYNTGNQNQNLNQNQNHSLNAQQMQQLLQCSDVQRVSRQALRIEAAAAFLDSQSQSQSHTQSQSQSQLPGHNVWPSQDASAAWLKAHELLQLLKVDYRAHVCELQDQLGCDVTECQQAPEQEQAVVHNSGYERWKYSDLFANLLCIAYKGSNSLLDDISYLLQTV